MNTPDGRDDDAPIVPDDLITPRKASRLLRAHISTVYRLILSGRLRAWKKGGARYLISRADLAAVLQPVVPRSPALPPWQRPAPANGQNHR